MADQLYALNISLTSKCNLRCKHCGASDSIDEIPFYNIKKIIYSAKKIGVKHIIFAGGEPFLRKDILNILTECENNSISFAVLTNGTLLHENLIEQLKKYRMLSYIRVSLDYSDAMKMESFRGMKGILNIVKNTVCALSKSCIPCGIGMTITNDNINDIIEVAKLAKEWGANFFRASPIVAIGRSQNLIKNNEFYINALNEMLKVHEFFGDYDSYPIMLLPKNLKEVSYRILSECPGGTHVAAISSNGMISRCPLSKIMINDRNIYTNTLEELVNNNKMECLKNKQELMQCNECSNCKHKLICKSGCLCEIEINESQGEKKPLCIKKIFEKVLEEECTPSRRRVINNILYKQNIYSNIPNCFRSSALWSLPLKGNMT